MYDDNYILQYIQIINHYVIHLKLLCYENYASIMKKTSERIYISMENFLFACILPCL